MFGKKRITLGLIVTVELENGKTYKAKVDTGADSSSIDASVAEQLGDKKILSHKVIKSALGKHKRPTIRVGIVLEGNELSERFTIADRSNLKYKVLIGKDILKKENFLVDPNKV